MCVRVGPPGCPLPAEVAISLRVGAEDLAPPPVAIRPSPVGIPTALLSEARSEVAAALMFKIMCSGINLF